MTQINPSGLCICGCGEKTLKVKFTKLTQLGMLRPGDYALYKRYHHKYGRGMRRANSKTN